MIAFDSPNEREVAMTALELELPPGIELVEASPATGWATAGMDGIVAWDHGTLSPGATAVFSAELRAHGEARTARVIARQRFADGATARWVVPVTVLPGADAADGLPGSVVVALAAAVAIVAASVLVAVLLRRRGHAR